MNTQDAFKFFQSIWEVTDKSLCQAAKVNAGQYSAWQRRGGPLSLEKIEALAQVFLDKTQPKNLASNEANSYAEASRVLSRLATDQEFDAINKPIKSTHPAFVSQRILKDLEISISRPPARKLIVSGTGFGKSSILNAIANFDLRRHQTYLIDFKEFGTSNSGDNVFFPWLVNRICEQHKWKIDKKNIPTSWLDFPKWIATHLLTANNYVSLVFDHVEALDENLIHELGANLHAMINQARDNQRLDAVNIVFAWNGAYQSVHGQHEHFTSDIVRLMHTIALPAFDLEEVKTLMRYYLKKSDAEIDHISGIVFGTFHGHPTLSHKLAWRLGGLDDSHRQLASADISSVGADPKIVQGMTEDFCDLLKRLAETKVALAYNKYVTPFWKPYATTNSAATPEKTIPVDDDICKTWLIDTGLFKRTSYEKNAPIDCISNWVASQLFSNQKIFDPTHV
jgi:hypothetical protein